jgi:hypothetical protein
MKFTTAWATTQSQNIVLKMALLLITGCAVVFATIAAKALLKEPLLIERSCLTQIIEDSSTKHTDDEISQFIASSMGQRFNPSETPIQSMFSPKEIEFKTQELKELKDRGMDQKIIIHTTKVSGNDVEIDADRLIMVGNVRSAFRFPLKAKIASTQRSLDNPYGLKVVKVERVQTEEKKNEKK